MRGSEIMERMVIVRIHFPLSTPSIGIITIGKIRATRIPLIIMDAIWLNTERPPRSVVFLVERGTIRLWLILKIVYAKE
jgi:hypothetical protein